MDSFIHSVQSSLSFNNTLMFQLMEKYGALYMLSYRPIRVQFAELINACIDPYYRQLAPKVCPVLVSMLQHVLEFSQFLISDICQLMKLFFVSTRAHRNPRLLWKACLLSQHRLSSSQSRCHCSSTCPCLYRKTSCCTQRSVFDLTWLFPRELLF
jgi:hypothetical protein